jgi:hypothetical protein
VVLLTSATQRGKLTEAERSSIWKPTSLIRRVACYPFLRKKCSRWCQKVPISSRLEGRWYELRPRKAGGAAFRGCYETHGLPSLKLIIWREPDLSALIYSDPPPPSRKRFANGHFLVSKCLIFIENLPKCYRHKPTLTRVACSCPLKADTVESRPRSLGILRCWETESICLGLKFT